MPRSGRASLLLWSSCWLLPSINETILRSQRGCHSVLWAGFTTAVVVLMAIAICVQSGLLRSERENANATPSTAVALSASERPGESRPSLRTKRSAEQEPHDKAAPPRLGVREKSAGEILGNLKETTKLSHQFHEKAEEIYLGRWIPEPGWQVAVDDLPKKLPGGLWSCSFKEVGSGSLVWAETKQDISNLRRGNLVTVTGRISRVSELGSVSLEEAILHGDNVPSP